MASRDDPTFANDFDRRFPQARGVMDLFAYLPSVYFYAKDHAHRYVGVNPPVLRDVFGLRDASELLGRTDAEFQPPTLAEAYHDEDRRVMNGGHTIANEVWLVPHVRGTPRWYKSTKTPLRNDHGRVIGLAGVMYPITTPEDQSLSFQELSPVMRYLDQHFTQAISMQAMADLVGLSTTHFNQRFRELLRMSPTQYVLARRIEYVRQLLVETDHSVAEIGAMAGFYDQSHFAKKFRQVTGLTPTGYRKKFGRA